MNERSGRTEGVNARRISPFILSLIPALVAGGLYWRSLSLPLFFDTLLHIRLSSANLNLANVWLPSPDFGYYRPFLFLPFLLIKPLFGDFPAPLLHGLSVAQHALNAFLITLLVWRLWQRRLWAVVAGALAATYPFSYQAVILFGNNIYPLATNLLLLGLHSYLSAVRDDGHGWRRRLKWAFAGAFFLASVLSHESAVLFGGLAALIHWQGTGVGAKELVADARNRGFSLVQRHPYLLFLAAGVLYIMLYQLLPIDAGPPPPETNGGQTTVSLYLLQSAVYPVAWFAHLLPDVPAHIILFVGLALLLALVWWAARRPSARGALFLGGVWWAAAVILPALALPPNYVLHGPRLFYLASLGIGLVWAVTLDTVRLWRGAGRWVWAAATLFILVSSSLFVYGRLEAAGEITEPVDVVVKTMDGRPAEEGVVLVNVPAWTSPPRNTFAVGAEFVTLLGRHLFPEELVEANAQKDHPVLAIVVPGLLRETPYPYGVYERFAADGVEANWAPAGSHVFITRYTESGLETVYTGRFMPPPEQSAPLARFGPYQLLAADATQCESVVQVRLIWQLLPDTVSSELATSSVFVQLLDDGGQMVSQADGPPLGLRPDLVTMNEGWRMMDRRMLPTARGEPGELLVGVYDFLSGERATATDGSGQRLPDDALRLRLAPCEGEH